jgi:hypothetical protein
MNDMEIENEMSRTFECNGRVFEVTATLNHLIERRMGGVKLHKVAISETGLSNWKFEQVCSTEQLLRTVKLCQSKAEDHALGIKSLTPEQKILSDMGFKFK